MRSQRTEEQSTWPFKCSKKKKHKVYLLTYISNLPKVSYL